ncbi:MAG TPA: hypothetical protein VHL53_13145 [Acidimicrobiia bacterium]|nr:hypothetical protein [Acidimicrobiia bacterium]
MRIPSLNRTVIAPLSSAIITVLIAGVVVAGIDKVDRNSVKEGTARLEATGLVEVSIGGAPFVKASHGRTLSANDHVRVISGGATLDLPHNSKVEMRSGSAVTVNGTAEPTLALDDGDLLVLTGRGDTLTIDGGTSLVSVAGAAKLRRGVSLAAGVYEGTARLQRNELGLTIPQYRQAAVVGSGILPQAPEPLSLSPSDEWDREELGQVMALDEQLTLITHTFEADAPASPGVDLFKQWLPRTADLPLTPELLGGRAPGENLIGLTLVALDKGDFTTRVNKIFGFRAQGATWGLVAADRSVNPTPVLNDLESALDILHGGSGTPSDVALGGGGSRPGGFLIGGHVGGGKTPVLGGGGGAADGTGGSGGTGTGGTGTGTGPGGTPATPGTGGNGGSGGSGGSGGGGNNNGGGKQKLIDIPPTGTFLDPILNPVVTPVEDLLSGLLGGLLGQGSPAGGSGSTNSTGTTSPSPATTPATLPPSSPTSGSTGSGTTGAGATSGSTGGVTATGSVSTGSTTTGQPATATTTTTSPGLLGGLVGGLTKTVGGLL